MASDIKPSIDEKAALSESTAESRTVLFLEGMTCASCAMRIEKGLKKVAGVMDANVNLATEQATVLYDPTQTNLEKMVQKVEAVGYKATPQVVPIQYAVQDAIASEATETDGHAKNIPQEDDLSRRKQAEIVRKRNLLILSIVLTVPVVILSMFFMNRFPGEN